MSNTVYEEELLEKMGYDKNMPINIIKFVDRNQRFVNALHVSITAEEYKQALEQNKGKDYIFKSLLDKVCKVTGMPRSCFTLYTSKGIELLVYHTGDYQYSEIQLKLFLQSINTKESFGVFAKHFKKLEESYLNHRKVGLSYTDALNKSKQEVPSSYEDKGVSSLDVQMWVLPLMLKYNHNDIDDAVKDINLIIRQLSREEGNSKPILRVLPKAIEYLKTPNNKANYTVDDLYEVWREVYNSINMDSGKLGEMMPKLWRKNNPEVTKRVSKLKCIANKEGYIKVYRGERETSVPTDKALSWTLSENIACSFAYRYDAKKFYRLVEGYIHIDDVYDTFLEDTSMVLNEMEILLDAKKVVKKKVTEVEGIEAALEVLQNDIAYLDIKSDNFRGSRYESYVTHIFNLMGYLDRIAEDFSFNTDTELFNCSDLHGRSHTARVLFHTINLIRLYEDEYELTDDEKEILIASALFHDIGREHDEEDMLHGQQAVDKMEYYSFLDTLDYMGIEDEDSIAAVNYLVAHHNIPDNLAKERLQDVDFEGDLNRLWLLYTILCDADGLDRIRIWDLDISYLRNKKAKLLLGFAQSLKEFWKI